MDIWQFNQHPLWVSWSYYYVTKSLPVFYTSQGPSSPDTFGMFYFSSQA